jgi:hypothetical protein
MNQMLFWDWKSVELLSNRDLTHFLLRIDGKINEVAWELKVYQWRKREESSGLFSSVWTIGEEERAIVEDRERYKYPPASQWSLKCSNAALSAAVLVCGTASLQVRHYRTHHDNKRWERLSWLSWQRYKDVLSKIWALGNIILTRCCVPLDSTAFLFLISKHKRNLDLLWARCHPWM